MLRNNADARQCSYFELGLLVVWPKEKGKECIMRRPLHSRLTLQIWNQFSLFAYSSWTITNERRGRKKSVSLCCIFNTVELLLILINLFNVNHSATESPQRYWPLILHTFPTSILRTPLVDLKGLCPDFFICFFLKRQCHIDATRFPSGPTEVCCFTFSSILGFHMTSPKFKLRTIT